MAAMRFTVELLKVLSGRDELTNTNSRRRQSTMPANDQSALYTGLFSPDAVSANVPRRKDGTKWMHPY